MLNYPVILFIYKRPSESVRVLKEIVEAKPKELYIFADGPRANEDVELIDATRAAVDSFLIDQTVKVNRVYRKTNLGLKDNIVSSLNYVFERTDAAIILEDDCLPNQDFFLYCNELLGKYKYDNKVLSISGFSPEWQSKYSYSFSMYPQCWGWASWARAWSVYDPNIEEWISTKNQTKNLSKFTNLIERKFWTMIIYLLNKGKISTWDYQWTLAHIANDGLAITPRVNLVENIGFGLQATNTKITTSYAKHKTKHLTFPLTHPDHPSSDDMLNKQIRMKHYLSAVPILGLLRKYFI